MTSRRRLAPGDRRNELLDAGAHLFAARSYDDVLMEEISERAGVSRALMYRYFSTKRAFFAAIYQRAADRLLAATKLDPTMPMVEQLSAGLDAHIDYFVANRQTVLSANRVLAGDPMIQAIISEELAELRRRMLTALDLDGGRREVGLAAIQAWLLFVREMCVEWLANDSFSRAELRHTCLGALLGAFGAPIDHGGVLSYGRLMWFYTIDRWDPASGAAESKLQGLLMERGADGWELVATLPLPDGVVLLTFKRQS